LASIKHCSWRSLRRESAGGQVRLVLDGGHRWATNEGGSGYPTWGGLRRRAMERDSEVRAFPHRTRDLLLHVDGVARGGEWL